MDYIVETNNLTKIFKVTRTWTDILRGNNEPSTIQALKQVNLKIKKGEIFCLVGPNGAGKTTLIKVLATFILPDEGSALVNGYDVLKDEKLVKQNIGLVSSEERSFYWRLSGRQNLKFFASLYGLKSKEAKLKIEELSQLLEIEDRLDEMFQKYSTGMKQRLGIARSLLNDAKVLLMDEPTKSLDPLSAINLRAFIKQKLVGEQGKTVIFTTHNLSEAENFSHRLAIIDQGRIKACGSLKQLKPAVPQGAGASIEDIFSFYIQN